MSLKHGLSNTRIYRIWNGMKQRCCNPQNPKYKFYGGKGITVCDEWQKNFISFYKWAINNGYNDPPKENSRLQNCWDALTLDRIDGAKGYEPLNCRWITFTENRKHPVGWKPSQDYRKNQ